MCYTIYVLNKKEMLNMQEQILQSLSGITILLVNLLLALAAYYIKKLTDKVKLVAPKGMNNADTSKLYDEDFVASTVIQKL